MITHDALLEQNDTLVRTLVYVHPNAGSRTGQLPNWRLLEIPAIGELYIQGFQEENSSLEDENEELYRDLRCSERYIEQCEDTIGNLEVTIKNYEQELFELRRIVAVYTGKENAQ